MNIINNIEIDHFRSIQSSGRVFLGDFSAFAGLNNAGKSNVLRALHAFFTGNTDIREPVRYKQDYYRNDLKSKKRRKNISVSVEFKLPDSFKFRKGLKTVEKFLGRSFVIKKSWTPDSKQPQYFLNASAQELPLEDRYKVDQFLSLINFRYIPNRVLPLDIIRNEHQALKDSLVRRLARRTKDDNKVFELINETSKTLIGSLEEALTKACPDVGSIRLDTPNSWQDFIFAFGYKLSSGGIEIEDTAQGSGIQSLLMFETLSLIDRDYFQKFGWKQAAVWAVEEPESSLHTSLEARIASYLAEIAQDSKSRLQIISTTHSDLMLQSADHTVFVSREKERSVFEVSDKKTVLAKAAMLGISRYTHPILADPLKPLVLVEGKFDHAFISRAIKLLAPKSSIQVSYLELLQEGKTGGIDDLIKYLRANSNFIRARISEAPIIVVLDWDAKSKLRTFEKICIDAPYKVLAWDESSFNPLLDKNFRGIERHLSDRIIDDADKKINVLGVKSGGKKVVNNSDYGKFKQAVFDVINEGLFKEDLVYAETFISEIITIEKNFRN
jgi:predicted ATP-dependent endonuclease of OLD family